MSTPQILYLDPKNSISKTMFSNVYEPQNNEYFRNKESNISKMQV
jgi:hypothetical protein